MDLKIKMSDLLKIMLTTVFVIPNLALPLKNAETDTARYNYFDIDLLRASSSSGNILLASALIKSGLNILLTGAKGSTAQELSTALRLPKEKHRRDDLLKNYGNALENNSESVILRSAGCLFLSDKLTTSKMTSDYIIMLKNIHKTDVQRMDFTDTNKASQSINNWINHATLGSVTEVLQPSSLDAESSLILTNAIYYRALWAKAFDKTDTKESCFLSNENNDENCHKVEMMSITDDFGYTDLPELDATAVEMDYEGNEYSMLIVLPNRGTDVSSLIRDLPYASLAQIDAKMSTQEVRVRLPKFTIDYEADIVRDLKEIGISTLFTMQNDLSGIFEPNKPTPVTSIIHKTVLEVSESGSTGSAVGITSIVPLMGSIAPLFDASRPFVYFIRHKRTGAVIFEGVLRNPSAKSKNIASSKTNGSKNPVLSKDISSLNGFPNKNLQTDEMVMDFDEMKHYNKEVDAHFGFENFKNQEPNSDNIMNYGELRNQNGNKNTKTSEAKNYQTLNRMNPGTRGKPRKTEVMYGDAPMRAMRISANNRPMNIDTSYRPFNIDYSINKGINFGPVTKNSQEINKNAAMFRHSFDNVKFGDNSDGIMFRER